MTMQLDEAAGHGRSQVHEQIQQRQGRSEFQPDTVRGQQRNQRPLTHAMAADGDGQAVLIMRTMANAERDDMGQDGGHHKPDPVKDGEGRAEIRVREQPIERTQRQFCGKENAFPCIYL